MMMEAYWLAASPEKLRETLCLAQAAIWHHPQIGQNSKRNHIAQLQRMIDECDRKRPLGPDGTHGDRHTAECGCEGYVHKNPSRYTKVPVECVDDGRVFSSIAECAKFYNTNSSAISKVLQGYSKRHHGLRFRRVQLPEA